MEAVGSNSKISARQWGHTSTEKPGGQRSQGPDLVATENVQTDENDEQTSSLELEFWDKRLKLEKKSASQGLQPLEHHAIKLRRAWQVFHDGLPAEERNILGSHAPDWDDIRNVVERVQASWIAKNKNTYGKATARLRKVLDTVHSHRTLLSILPESNNYASLFCGSLQVLIQASATYRTVAEGLSKAILELNEIVQAWCLDIELFRGNDHVGMAATLYCRIFEFLDKAMSWYTKSRARRFINSFKEDAYEVFASDVVEIRRFSENSWRRAQHSVHIESRTTNLMLQQTRQSVRNIEQLLISQQTHSLGIHAIGDANFLGHAQSHRVKTLTGCTENTEEPITTTLEIKEPYLLQHPDATEERSSESGPLGSPHAPSDPPEECKSLVVSHKLRRISVQNKVSAALQDWCLDSNAQFLYLSGPWQKDIPSPAYQLATAIYSFAIQAEVAAIHFSCTSSVQENGEDVQKESNPLLHLVNSLNVQLIEILSEGCHSREISDIYLNANTKTFASALQVLKTLLVVVHLPLFCVIGNLQYLEYHPTENADLISFLDILRAHSVGCPNELSARPFKVLFTTSGYSTALMEFLEPDEMVVADILVPDHSPGRSIPSQGPMVPITPELFESYKIRDGEETEEDVSSS